MVTILPQEESNYNKAFENFGAGIGKGYQNRSDELSIQRAIEGLGPNPQAADVLKAITGASTYDNASKKAAFDQYLGAENVKIAQEKNRIADAKKEQKAADKLQKTEDEKLQSDTIIDQSPDLSPEQKKVYKDAGLKPAQAVSVTQNPTKSLEYEVAKNVGEQYKKTAQNYQDKGEEAEVVMPLVETAIVNNEKYGGDEKLWDQIIEATGSNFLQQFKSKTGQELEVAIPVAVQGFGAKMGGQLTNAKMNLIQKKAYGLGKDKAANRLLLYLDYFNRKLDTYKQQISNDIIRKNKFGLPPADYQNQINKRLKPIQKLISQDIDRLLQDKKPVSAIGSLGIESQVDEGWVPMLSKDGKVGQVKEENVDQALNDDYIRL